MDKLQMAHEFAMKLIECRATNKTEDIIRLGWEYADAMQSEADKRNKAEDEKKRADIREMLKADNTFIEREGQHFDDVEWQPDWSQAPDWAVAWTIDSAECLWWSYTPRFKNNFWFVDDSISWKCDDAPSFNYAGNWQESLRNRPQ